MRLAARFSRGIRVFVSRPRMADDDVLRLPFRTLGGLQRGKGCRLDRGMWDVDALLPFAESGRGTTYGKSRLTLGESGGGAGGLELFSKH
jgi:hypothetical protein